ncbi:MAG: MarR family winged helix-turn-helix transcriptional regulator [Pseudomonadota bacterium]
MASLKAAHALQLWKSTTLAQVHGEDPDLTTRQMALLLTVYLDPPPHTVRGLAAQLGVTKPVITRALDTMGIMGLVSRRRDERDRRNVLVQRTVKGSEYLERLGALVSRHASELN